MLCKAVKRVSAANFCCKPAEKEGEQSLFRVPADNAVRRKPECSLKPAHRVLRVCTENAVNSVR